MQIDVLRDVENIVIAGCYEYDEISKSRKGGLLRISCDSLVINDPNPVPPQIYETGCGIYDLQIVENTIVAATSNTTVKFIRLLGDEFVHIDETPPIQDPQNPSLENIVATSVAIDPCDSQVLVSASNGCVGLLNKRGTLVRTIKAHSYECWKAEWMHFDSNLFATGGEDHKLRFWDVRSATNTHTLHHHTGGVVCIRNVPNSKHNIISGSYDDKVRMWDLRSLAAPVYECDTGGGVWECVWLGGSRCGVVNCYNGISIWAIDGGLMSREMSLVAPGPLIYGAAAIDETRILYSPFYEKTLIMSVVPQVP